MSDITVFSFGGAHCIVTDHGRAVPHTQPNGVGQHVILTQRPRAPDIGSIVELDGSPSAIGEMPVEQVRPFAMAEIKRLYEREMRIIENNPSQAVRDEWQQKELAADIYMSDTTDVDLKTRAGAMLLVSLTTQEIAAFDAIGATGEQRAAATAQAIREEAWKKRGMMSFAGRQRREANALIESATTYLQLAQSVVYIQNEVPARVAQFLATLP